jgi:hypothetical protein
VAGIGVKFFVARMKSAPTLRSMMALALLTIDEPSTHLLRRAPN